MLKMSHLTRPFKTLFLVTLLALGTALPASAQLFGGREAGGDTAELLLRIRERLNNDSHVKLTAQEYRDAGDAVELKPNGLSEAHVQVLRYLFEAHEFPVRMISAAAGEEDADT